MYLLALDTATNSGGVALARNAELVGLVMIKRPLDYSERILEYVDLVLRQFDLQPGDVDCFVAAVGPGSFTGLRIGIATVKGFAQSLDRPVVGISSLAALAFRFRHVASRVCPMMDARRQQVFAGLFEAKETEVRPLLEERACRPADWLHSLPPEPCLCVGDGAQMYASMIAGLRPQDRVLRTDNAILPELCRLGYEAYVRGEATTPERLAAHYLRPADAEQARADT